jgi:hypothetical protein
MHFKDRPAPNQALYTTSIYVTTTVCIHSSISSPLPVPETSSPGKHKRCARRPSEYLAMVFAGDRPLPF